MTSKLAYFTLIAAVMSISSKPVWAQRAEIMTWSVGGENRRAIVYQPSAAAAGSKSPLVFSFHGRCDNIENFQHTDMHLAWPEAIVVYFEGLPTRDGRLHQEGLS